MLSWGGWWTSFELPEEHVIELYKGQAVCEQYHSEFKTDLDIERLPSGKFATNGLILSLVAFAYDKYPKYNWSTGTHWMGTLQ